VVLSVSKREKVALMSSNGGFSIIMVMPPKNYLFYRWKGSGTVPACMKNIYFTGGTARGTGSSGRTIGIIKLNHRLPATRYDFYIVGISAIRSIYSA
jgi:hypothetical protein